MANINDIKPKLTKDEQIDLMLKSNSSLIKSFLSTNRSINEEKLNSNNRVDTSNVKSPKSDNADIILAISELKLSLIGRKRLFGIFPKFFKSVEDTSKEINDRKPSKFFKSITNFLSTTRESLTDSASRVGNFGKRVVTAPGRFLSSATQKVKSGASAVLRAPVNLAKKAMGLPLNILRGITKGVKSFFTKKDSFKDTVLSFINGYETNANARSSNVVDSITEFSEKWTEHNETRDKILDEHNVKLLKTLSLIKSKLGSSSSSSGFGLGFGGRGRKGGILRSVGKFLSVGGGALLGLGSRGIAKGASFLGRGAAAAGKGAMGLMRTGVSKGASLLGSAGRFGMKALSRLNPVGAVAGAGAAGYALGKYINDNLLSDNTKRAISDAIGPVISNTIDFFSNIGSKAVEWYDSAKGKFTEITQSLNETYTTAMVNIGDTIGPAIDGALGFFEKAGSTISGWFSDADDEIAKSSNQKSLDRANLHSNNKMVSRNLSYMGRQARADNTATPSMSNSRISDYRVPLPKNSETSKQPITVNVESPKIDLGKSTSSSSNPSQSSIANTRTRTNNFGLELLSSSMLNNGV